MGRPDSDEKQSVVRRVVKKNNRFYCGICGRDHAYRKLAESCVEACLEKESKNARVKIQDKKKTKKYRCSYCKRIYLQVNQAKKCVEDCKNRAAEKHELEKKFGIQSMVPDLAKAEKLAELAENMNQSFLSGMSDGDKIIKKGRQYLCRQCRKPYSDRQQAIDCFDQHLKSKKQSAFKDRIVKAKKQIDQQAVALKKQESAQVAHEAKVAQERKRSLELARQMEADSKKFKMEGKFYVCQKCHERYETRKEVIACYNRHATGEDALVGKKAGGRKGDPNAMPVAEEPIFQRRSPTQDPADFELDVTKRKKKKVARGIPDKDKFIRDGAKYACRQCNQKYFTKQEVIRCFDSHDKE